MLQSASAARAFWRLGKVVFYCRPKTFDWFADGWGGPLDCVLADGTSHHWIERCFPNYPERVETQLRCRLWPVGSSHSGRVAGRDLPEALGSRFWTIKSSPPLRAFLFAPFRLLNEADVDSDTDSTSRDIGYRKTNDTRRPVLSDFLLCSFVPLSIRTPSTI